MEVNSYYDLLCWLLSINTSTASAYSQEWVNKNDNWYFYNSNGIIHKGWLSLSSTWYYFDSKGVMQSVWIYDGHGIKREWGYVSGVDNNRWCYLLL
ncbi:hypothetical protein FZW96_07285 [Bacillus sp. BGMRC 2118]|nr:hypothetical protein FZW96_07285 [Bacillus sp. BGMRC 2118]